MYPAPCNHAASVMAERHRLPRRWRTRSSCRATLAAWAKRQPTPRRSRPASKAASTVRIFVLAAPRSGLRMGTPGRGSSHQCTGGTGEDPQRGIAVRLEGCSSPRRGAARSPAAASARRRAWPCRRTPARSEPWARTLPETTTSPLSGGGAATGVGGRRLELPPRLSLRWRHPLPRSRGWRTPRGTGTSCSTCAR
jgi:hypothetical protein